MKLRLMMCFALVMIMAGISVWAEGQQELQKKETILKIGTPNEIKSANIFSDYYLGIFAHISNPPLMKMDEKGNLTGLTAEEFEVSEDNKIWTFIIRDNLFWSDGKKVTAEDVVFSVKYTGDHNPNARWIKDTLEKTEVLDGNRAVFHFNKPYTRLNLEFATYNIFPEHVWKNIQDPMKYLNAGLNIGFGPFIIEKIDLDAGTVIFSQNPFWAGEKPSLDGFEIHIYKNSDILSLALEKGDVDTYYKYASSYPYAGLQRLEKTGGFAFSETLNMGLVFLAFNLEKKPFSNPVFREAFSYIINYEELLKLDALGYGKKPNRGFVPPSMGGYMETQALKYDPEKALELFDKAGYTEDKRKDLTLSVLVRSDWNRVAELIQDYLSAVGIVSTVRSLDLNSWAAEKDNFNYDVTITRTTPWGMLMHAGWGTGYYDSRRSGRGVLHSVEDPEFLNLCDIVLGTTDKNRLSELGEEVQDYYARNLPGIPLYWNTIVIPYNKDFTGWKPDPLYGIYNLDTFVTLKKKNNN